MPVFRQGRNAVASRTCRQAGLEVSRRVNFEGAQPSDKREQTCLRQRQEASPLLSDASFTAGGSGGWGCGVRAACLCRTCVGFNVTFTIQRLSAAAAFISRSL